MVDELEEIDSQKVTARLCIPLAPMSANRAYRVFRGRSIKSKEYREYEIAFNHYMAAHFDQCRAFLEQFDTNTHAIKVNMDFYFPYQDIMTKSGRLKLRGQDLDNCVKHCLDNVFKFLNLDDGIVCDLNARKIPSHTSWTVVTLERVKTPSHHDIPDLPKWSEVDH